MGLHEFQSTLNPDRLDFLVKVYSISPEVIREKRKILGKLWYGLSYRRPIDELQEEEYIQHAAIEGAREFELGRVEGVLQDRSPCIKISESDLSTLQNASNIAIHSNHQRYWDIPYLAQTLRELIGTDASTHFIMKKGVPFPEFFQSAGGIIVLRGKDLKKQAIENKKRLKKGDPILDIESERPELIRPKDLPSFLHAFTQEQGRNTLIFDKGTRSGNSFHYEDKVIGNMQASIDATPHNVHVLVGINYCNGYFGSPEISLTVLNEDEMRNGNLGDTVNGFLNKTKEGK